MMTYDDMPAGREMDYAICEKVFGWRRSPGGFFFPPNLHPAANIYGYSESSPDYSTSIPAAWEVVEKINQSIEIKGIYLDWYVEFGGYPRTRSGGVTLPLAICRAALKSLT